MKRSLSSLITDTNVRDYEVKEININIIYESDSQARKIVGVQDGAVPSRQPLKTFKNLEKINVFASWGCLGRS